MNLISDIQNHWGWTGLEPVEIVGENEFGNLMIKDVEGKYWRLAPEDCTCVIVASDRGELELLSTNQEFLRDWNMRALVAVANDQLGPLADRRKYCMKIPAPLGGEYGGANFATAPLDEIIRISGDIARQIQSLPEGATVSLKVVD